MVSSIGRLKGRAGVVTQPTSAKQVVAEGGSQDHSVAGFRGGLAEPFCGSFTYINGWFGTAARAAAASFRSAGSGL
jgi:hypothetical protein